MELRLVTFDPEIIRMACEGDIDEPNYSDAVNAFEKVLGPGRYSANVLLSMERVGFLGSSGISWLIACHKQFKQAGGKLVLHTLPPMVRNALQLMRMSLVLNMAEDEAAARVLALEEKK